MRRIEGYEGGNSCPKPESRMQAVPGTDDIGGEARRERRGP